MAKVSGAYESVVRGVSEQVPQDRRPGQHFEQVNMISDPVRGLARRHGSLLMSEQVLTAYSDAEWNARVADTAQHRARPFFVAGKEYDLIGRSAALAPTGYTYTPDNFAYCYSKADQAFIPVVTHTAADDPICALLKSGGISAFVNVGKYVFIGGNSVIPNYTYHDAWGDTSNQENIIAWVRGGAYSRTYTITLTKTDGTKLTASYTTMASSYPTLLDTSDIPATATDYQKQVNDRVNAYNSAVTRYIGLAAADIVPSNIVTKLRDALVTAGVTAGTMAIDDSSLLISNSAYIEIVCDDSGDGSLFRGVGNVIRDIDSVSAKHYVGKIVKVRPTKNDETDTLYIQARARDGVSTGLQDVTWVEGCGYQMTPLSPFCLGTITDGTLYIAGTPALLGSLTGEAVPEFKANSVGDQVTCPLPYFIGRSVDFLGLWQDRLVIGSGATLFFSKPGDYFNWFRGSVLDVADNDPVEVYALGSEDDTIKTSTTFDRNMLLFGKRKQYTVDGQTPLRPSTAAVVIMAAHEDAVDAWPQNSGNFVFYAQTRNGASSVHQLQVGQLLDSPESYQVSQQLDRYLDGHPVEIVAVTTPNMVLLRTDSAVRNQVFTYSYLDTAAGTQRLFDSWSRWTWDSSLGVTVGLSQYLRDVLIYTLRHGLDKDGNHKIWLVADKFVLDSQLSGYPYLDSMRLTSDAITPTSHSFINPYSTLDDVAWVAFGNDGTNNRFLGTDMANLTLFLEQYPTAATTTWTGIEYPAYVTPTNPYVRDQKGKAILMGRMSLGRLNITIVDSGGFKVTVATPNLTYVPVNFTGRLSGRISNLVGRAPIVSTSVGALIGREIRECQYTISAQTFLPLTISSIDWAGQLFNNVQRVPT